MMELDEVVGYVGASQQSLLGTSGSNFSSPIDATAPWYLLFTSGTTSLPKAVIQTAQLRWANAINIGQAIDLISQDQSVNFLFRRSFRY